MEEVLSEGKNFKLVNEPELPEIIEFLEQYLPDSIKVRRNSCLDLNFSTFEANYKYITVYLLLLLTHGSRLSHRLLNMSGGFMSQM